jgi:hypothetical protein
LGDRSGNFDGMGLGDEEKEHADSHNSRKETIARAHEAAVLKYGREVRLSEAKNMKFALQGQMSGYPGLLMRGKSRLDVSIV